jgi:hypothetical protein
MSDLNIPIERYEELHGILRERGQPDLIAHRPEPWRLTRLARVLGAMRALATQQIGPEAAQAITESMMSIADYKGDFHIVWRQSKHNEAFDDIATRALQIEGENDLECFVDPDF